MIPAFGPFARRLARDTGGLALIEFAMAMPVFVTLCVGGAELANYITTRMRVSQIALQIADNAARMGTGSPLAAKTVTELDINDIFAGAQLESGTLDLNGNGRIILSDLEPVATPNTTDRYKIVWQRCYGTKSAHASSYGAMGDTDKPYMGPPGKQSKALPGGATMFVEVYYLYKPIIKTQWVPEVNIVEVASMAVRDRRNLLLLPTNLPVVSISGC